MSEKTMRRRVLKALKGVDACPVENHICPGTPDVNCSAGWIELKWLRKWPKYAEERPVTIEHFTPQQRVWLSRRAKVGGVVFLMFQVGREWFLFDGAWAAVYFGKVERPVLQSSAYAYWKNGLNDEELLKCLKSRS